MADNTPTCNAETARGEPCKNPATDNGYCWIPAHNPDIEGDEYPAGRSSKLTLERQEGIAGMIEQGHSMTAASRAHSINKATLFNWMARGEAEKDAGNDNEYTALYDRVTRARGTGEANYVNHIRKLANDSNDTAALISMLKQRYPESWGDVDRGSQAGGVNVYTDPAETTEIDPETLEIVSGPGLDEDVDETNASSAHQNDRRSGDDD